MLWIILTVLSYKCSAGTNLDNDIRIWKTHSKCRILFSNICSVLCFPHGFEELLNIYNVCTKNADARAEKSKAMYHSVVSGLCFGIYQNLTLTMHEDITNSNFILSFIYGPLHFGLYFTTLQIILCRCILLNVSTIIRERGSFYNKLSTKGGCC